MCESQRDEMRQSGDGRSVIEDEVEGAGDAVCFVKMCGYRHTLSDFLLFYLSLFLLSFLLAFTLALSLLSYFLNFFFSLILLFSHIDLNLNLPPFFQTAGLLSSLFTVVLLCGALSAAGNVKKVLVRRDRIHKPTLCY